MFFYLSKILSFLLLPVNHLLLILFFYFGSKKLKFQKSAKLFFILLIFVISLYGMKPFSTVLLRNLENYSKVPESYELTDITGIIVLGGFSDDGLVSMKREQAQFNRASERIITAISIHKKYPLIPIWISGFSGKINHRGWDEEKTTKNLLDNLHINKDNFFFENKSRNTYENAVFTYKLINPNPDQKWVLITSASHMYRAHLTFKAAKWKNLILYPVDFQTTPSGFEWTFNLHYGFINIYTALHEYLGIVAYKLTNKI